MSSLMLQRWSRLYSNMTPAERALEPMIARLGVPYRVQHPLWALGVFPDFALPQQRVVIEVDDPSHDRAAQKIRDQERTAKLERAGWKVVRCKNQEALTDPAGTVNRLMRDAGLPHLQVRL